MTSVPDMLRPRIEEALKSHGQMLTGVMPTFDEPELVPFYYTIGMKTYGMPDLLCIGRFPSDVIGRMLNTMCHLMRKREGMWEEGLADIEWSIPVKVRKCGDRAKEDYTVQAGQFYGDEDYEVWQVMICDKNGVYQDEGGCEYGLVDMP